MKAEPVGYTPLLNNEFNTSDKKVLPYSWHKRNYTDMLYTFDPVNAPWGNNDGSSLQPKKLIRKPANVFVWRRTSNIDPEHPKIQSVYNENYVLGDMFDFEGRLSRDLKKEAFVCWGEPNTSGLNAIVREVTPRRIIDPLHGGTAPADPKTFKGGRFIGIINPSLTYDGTDVFPEYDDDVNKLLPYIKLFDSFNVFVLVDHLDFHLLALAQLFPVTDPPIVDEVTAFYAGLLPGVWATIKSQCASLSESGFEAVGPGYTAILKRIRKIFGP